MGRIQAVVLWIMGAAIAATPFVAPNLVKGLLPGHPGSVPTWVYGVSCAIGAGVAWQGVGAWKRGKPKATVSESQAILAGVLTSFFFCQKYSESHCHNR
jgi:hypothetical protein